MKVRFLEPNAPTRLLALLLVPLLWGSSVFAQPDATQTHLVKKGETLYAISRQYNLTVEELRQLNQLKGNTIFVNQTLNVGLTASQANQRVAAAEADPAETQPTNRGLPGFDDRSTYADPYGNESYQELTYLQRRRQAAYEEQGEFGFASSDRGLPDQATVAQKTYYQVKPGENLYQLAVRFGVQAEELREWNMIRTVRPGQTIVVRQEPVEVDMAQSARRTYADQTRNNRGETFTLGGTSATQQPASLNVLQLEGGETPGQGEIKVPGRTRTQQPTTVRPAPNQRSAQPAQRSFSPTNQPTTRSLASADPEIPLLSQLLHSPEKHLYLGSQVESGSYQVFVDAFLTDKTFYLAHKTLPIGTIVYMDIPNNAGFLELEVVENLSPRNQVAVGLSPACVELLKQAGSPREVTLIYD